MKLTAACATNDGMAFIDKQFTAAEFDTLHKMGPAAYRHIVLVNDTYG